MLPTPVTTTSSCSRAGGHRWNVDSAAVVAADFAWSTLSLLAINYDCSVHTPRMAMTGFSKVSVGRTLEVEASARSRSLGG